MRGGRKKVEDGEGWCGCRKGVEDEEEEEVVVE